MKRLGKYIRIALIFSVLFVNVTGFSSAAFLDWMSSGKSVIEDVDANDMPPQWQQDILEFISCGRVNGG